MPVRWASFIVTMALNPSASRNVAMGAMPADTSSPGEVHNTKAPGCNWPEGEWWPEYFMFGDPHVNYYEGQVLYDDVKLEVWR